MVCIIEYDPLHQVTYSPVLSGEYISGIDAYNAARTKLIELGINFARVYIFLNYDNSELWFFENGLKELSPITAPVVPTRKWIIPRNNINSSILFISTLKKGHRIRRDRAEELRQVILCEIENHRLPLGKKA